MPRFLTLFAAAALLAPLGCVKKKAAEPVAQEQPGGGRPVRPDVGDPGPPKPDPKPRPNPRPDPRPEVKQPAELPEATADQSASRLLPHKLEVGQFGRFPPPDADTYIEVVRVIDAKTAVVQLVQMKPAPPPSAPPSLSNPALAKGSAEAQAAINRHQEQSRNPPPPRPKLKTTFAPFVVSNVSTEGMVDEAAVKLPQVFKVTTKRLPGGQTLHNAEAIAK